jgi:branched-chain amino acid aminotransferase
VNKLVYLNGLFWHIDKANISVLDRGFIYGDGLFETFRSYSKKIFKVDEHLDRLYYSASLIFIEIPMTRGEIKSALNELLILNGLSNALIRLTVTRGNQGSGISIDYASAPTIVIQARPLTPKLQTYYKKGVTVSLFKNSAYRTQGISDQIKSCNYLSQILMREKALKVGSFEAILLDNKNNITEGTISNIFLIKNNQLVTPKLNEFILKGITRQVVLELARANNVSCKETMVSKKNLYEADEIFITNSGIEILPVVTVNNQVINKGKPGPITKFLHMLFLKSFED